MTEKHSKVRWDKVLRNYRDSYNYEEPWEIAVIELVANAIDARAKTIEILSEYNGVDRVNLKCIDDGEGMDKNEFEEYHNLGSLTKGKGGTTIGFAGIGAKLTLDLCEKVYTETRKKGKNSILASDWWFDHSDNEPKYQDNIMPRRMLKKSHGTYVEIYGLQSHNFSEKKLKHVIYVNYQYALEKINIIVNGNKLENPVKLMRKTAKESSKIKNPSKSKVSFIGEISYLDDDGLKKIKDFYRKETGMDEIYTNWFDIVVCGKTILREENFKLNMNVPVGEWQYIVGYIRCDELIDAVKTSKDDVNKRTWVWKEFSKQASSVIAKWLYRQGLYKEYDKAEEDKEFNKRLRSIEKDLNNLLKGFPEILEKMMPATPPIKPKSGEHSSAEGGAEMVPISDSKGSGKGHLETGGELGRGTYGGPGESEGPVVPHPGENEDIKAPREGESGISITHKRIKRGRRGIGISWKPIESKETIEWIPSENIFVINEDHPAAILASQHVSSKMFYTVYQVLHYIAENFTDAENNEEKVDNFWELYEAYIRMLE